MWKPLESFSLILPRRLAPQTRVLHFLAVLTSLSCAILTPATGGRERKGIALASQNPKAALRAKQTWGCARRGGYQGKE